MNLYLNLDKDKMTKTNRIKRIKNYWAALKKLNKKLHIQEAKLLMTLSLEDLEDWEHDLAFEIYEIENNTKELKEMK